MAAVAKIKSDGDFSKTKAFLQACIDLDAEGIAEKYGEVGVDYLAAATPADTGMTADSWDYEIEQDTNNKSKGGDYVIVFTNSNENDGANVALLLEYGHGTRQGGYVPPYEYIDSAIEEAYEEMVDEIMGEVDV